MIVSAYPGANLMTFVCVFMSHMQMSYQNTDFLFGLENRMHNEICRHTRLMLNKVVQCEASQKGLSKFEVINLFSKLHIQIFFFFLHHRTFYSIIFFLIHC